MSNINTTAHTLGTLRWDRQISVIWRDNTRFAGEDMGSDEIACDVEQQYGPMFAASLEVLEALEAIVESATDGREIPEWLEERLVIAKSAVRKSRGRQ
jgi:hypothetical protein